jgi:hypothetical protein
MGVDEREAFRSGVAWLLLRLVFGFIAGVDYSVHIKYTPVSCWCVPALALVNWW